jgi:hypothetical protein
MHHDIKLLGCPAEIVKERVHKITLADMQVTEVAAGVEQMDVS